MKNRLRLIVLQMALLLAAALPAQAQSISTLAAQAAGNRPAESVASAPAGASIEAAAVVSVPVATVTLYPGDIIAATMLKERDMPLAELERKAFAARNADIVGKSVRRIIVADQPVPLNAITEAIVVTKGVATRVHLSEGGLTISGFAMPLESGGAGALIRLKNIHSGEIIVGVVEPNGSVRINMQ